MKRRSAYRTELLRTIRGSLGRFLAIFGIVALGCGFYAGLRMCGPSMRTAADVFYDGTRLDDLRVVSSLGLTNEQARLISKTEGVGQVMGVRSCDVMATLNGEQYAMRVASFDARAARASSADATGAVVTSASDAYLNRLVLARGDWPRRANECVISADRVMGTPIQVGDEVEVLYGTSDLDGVLAVRSFRVSGLVHASEYPSSVSLGYTSLGSGTIQQYLYVTDEAFDPELPYTMVVATVEGAEREVSGSERYQRVVDEVATRLKDGAPSLAASRLAQVRREAEEELDEAQADYDEAEAEATERLGEAAAELDDAARRLGDARDELDAASAQLKDSRAQLDDARASLAQGERQVRDGRAALDGAKAQLAQRQAQWDAARPQLEQAAAGLAQLADGIAQLDAGIVEAEGGLAQARAKDEEVAAQEAQLQAQLAGLPPEAEERAALEAALAQAQEGRAAIAEQVAQATEGRAALAAQRDELAAAVAATEAQVRAAGFEPDGLADQIAATNSQLEQAAAEVAANEARLNASASQLSRARATYDSGKRSYEEGQADYEAGESDYEEGQAEYAQGRAEYERERAKAADELADAARQLAEARSDVDALDPPDVYVLDRTSRVGVAAYLADSERIDHIASVFPLIFFLVAALVALTTMTRMVEEERQEIGCHKALGFSRAAITGKYLAYGSVASLLGALVGIAVLTQVLPFVVMKAYAIMYAVPFRPLPLAVDPLIAASALVAGVGITLFSTWASAAATLREVPATLMLPRAPKPGKRIVLERVRPVWSRMSFSWKVTCRNLFRYKKRLFMTVVGIAGCTGLLLTGLGLHDSIWDIIAVQYEGDEPLFAYNLVVGLEDDARKGELGAVRGMLDEAGAHEVAEVYAENMQVASQAHPATVGVSAEVVDDPEAFGGFVTLRDRLTHEPVRLDGDAVVLTEKLANWLGVGVGDTFTLFEQDDVGNAEGAGHELVVTGVVENYVYHYCYLGSRAWKRGVGRSASPNTLLARVDVAGGLAERLHASDAVSTVTFNTETIDGYRKSLRSVNMIVVVLILAAAALAFIVLYNLTNINIIERSREIASLKVLGFTRGEVAAYVFREITLLVLVGAALGLAFGTVLVTFVIQAAEVDAVMFGRSVHLASYVWAYLLTIVFTAAVMLAMLPKLRAIDMVESLKSVD